MIWKVFSSMSKLSIKKIRKTQCDTVFFGQKTLLNHNSHQSPKKPIYLLQLEECNILSLGLGQWQFSGQISIGSYGEAIQ